MALFMIVVAFVMAGYGIAAALVKTERAHKLNLLCVFVSLGSAAAWATLKLATDYNKTVASLPDLVIPLTLVVAVLSTLVVGAMTVVNLASAYEDWEADRNARRQKIEACIKAHDSMTVA